MQDRPTDNNKHASFEDDRDNIELLTLEEKAAPLVVMTDDEIEDNNHCYTLEYACAPFKAACHEVRTSSTHLRAGPDNDDNASSRCETVIQLGCATPLMFTAAAIVSVFGFFAGAARDGYRAIQNNCCVVEEDSEPVQTNNLKV